VLRVEIQDARVQFRQVDAACQNGKDHADI
jgi:hypothetical protein